MACCCLAVLATLAGCRTADTVQPVETTATVETSGTINVRLVREVSGREVVVADGVQLPESLLSLLLEQQIAKFSDLAETREQRGLQCVSVDWAASDGSGTWYAWTSREDLNMRAAWDDILVFRDGVWRDLWSPDGYAMSVEDNMAYARSRASFLATLPPAIRAELDARIDTRHRLPPELGGGYPSETRTAPGK